MQRGSKYYYFAYPEDHSRTEIEYDGDEDRPKRRLRRPTFEVIFIYDPSDGTLSTFFKGRSAEVRDLQELFAREILITHLPSPTRDQRVYELNPIKYRDFQFKYEPTSGITEVRIKQMKLAIIGGSKKRIALDVDHNSGYHALYDFLDDALDTGEPVSKGNHIPLSMVNVTRVGITAYFVPSGRRKRPSKTFYVAYPNSCSLKHEGRDLSLRQMLNDSGIEPNLPGKV